MFPPANRLLSSADCHAIVKTIATDPTAKGMLSVRTRGRLGAAVQIGQSRGNKDAVMSAKDALCPTGGVRATEHPIQNRCLPISRLG